MQIENNENHDYIHHSSEDTFTENRVSRDRNNKNNDFGIQQQQKETVGKPKESSANFSPTTTSTGRKKRRRKSGSKWYEKSTRLGMNFKPGNFDVICARGNVAWNNRKFIHA